MKPRMLSAVLVLLALFLAPPAAQATRTAPHLAALRAAELPPPALTTADLEARPASSSRTPGLPLLSARERTLSAALSTLDEPDRARLLALRRLRLSAAAAPLSRPEPPVWGQKTASRRNFWPAAPNLWETRLLNPDLRQGGLFLEPDPLGPVDSPNLYQAFGFDGLNVRDPFGECKWNDWECWGWVAKDFAGKTGHDLWNLASLGTLERVEHQKNLGTLGGVAESAFQGARSISNVASFGLQESIYQTQMREGPGVKSVLKGTGEGLVALTPYEEGKTLITNWSSLDAAQRWHLGMTAVSKTAGLAAGATALGERALATASMDELATATQEGLASLPPGRYQQVPALAQGDEVLFLSAGESGGLRSPNLGMPEGVSYEGFVYRGGSWRIHRGNLAAEHRYSAPGRGALYTSLEPRTAVAELQHAGVPLGEIRLQGQGISVEKLLNLADPSVRRELGVSLSQLTSEDYGIPQALGDWARARGYKGIIAPSARRAGGHNLVLFGEPQ